MPPEQLAEPRIIDVPLDLIQGNITPGFRKDFQELLFVRFPSAQAGRDWVKELWPTIATASTVARFNAFYRELKPAVARADSTPLRFIRSTWVNVAFSPSGMYKLLPDSHEHFGEAFAAGMWNRSDKTGDTKETKDAWTIRDTRFDELLADQAEAAKVPDAVLIIGADLDADLDAEHKAQVDLMDRHGIRELARQRAATLDEPREQFGFRDGISQPDPGDPLKGWPRDPGGEQIVAPGEFIIGCEVEPDPPAAPAAGAVVAAPVAVPAPVAGAADNIPTWKRYGSYLVFRKYQQHVDVFNREAAAWAEALKPVFPEMTPELLAAKLFGRWKSGILLEKWTEDGPNLVADPASPESGAPKPDSKDLAVPKDYFTSDKLGDGCPLFGHIRKAHPRGHPTADARKHRIIRRGIPYDDGGEGKGLLFLGYQAQIEQAFEYIHENWFNNGKFPGTPTSGAVLTTDRPGIDPIVGIYPAGGVNSNRAVAFHLPIDGELPLLLASPLDPARPWKRNLERFVTVKGGAYFFSPSISGLRTLAGDTAVDDAAGAAESGATTPEGEA